MLGLRLVRRTKQPYMKPFSRLGTVAFKPSYVCITCNLLVRIRAGHVNRYRCRIPCISLKLKSPHSPHIYNTSSKIQQFILSHLENNLTTLKHLSTPHTNPPNIHYVSISASSKKVRSIEEETHNHPRQGPSNRDSQDPRQQQQANTLKVDGLDGAIAQSHPDGGARDTHGGRHGQRELRKDKHGDGRAHLHGAAPAGRVVRDLVAHDLHDVVTISDQSRRDGEGEHCKLPEGHGRLGPGGVARAPGCVDNGPGADRVADVVSAVRKGSSASSQDLHERVCVFDLVGVLLCVQVHSLHPAALWRACDAGLCSVDVVS